MLDLNVITSDPHKRLHPGRSMNEIRALDALAGHQGRTRGGRFTHSTMMFDDGDNFPPDSKYWKRDALASMQFLADCILDQYHEWAELTWPGPTIDKFSWRTISDMTEASIKRYGEGERDIHILAEAAHQRLAQLVKEEENAN